MEGTWSYLTKYGSGDGYCVGKHELKWGTVNRPFMSLLSEESLLGHDTGDTQYNIHDQ